MGDEGPKTKPRSGGNSSPWMPRLRKRGEKLLHSKYTVILVIVLTVIDCSLVIAELILDLYSVKKTLLSTEGQTIKFILQIRYKYPEYVRPSDSVASIYERIAYSTIVWNTSKDLDLLMTTRNLDTTPVSVSTVGMSHASVPGIRLPRNDKEARGSSYENIVLVESGNRSAFHSSHRSGPSRNNNISFAYRDLYQDNERTTRFNLESVLNEVVRRVRRNSNTGIRNTSVPFFTNSNTTLGSIEGDGNFVDDVDDSNDDNNDNTRHIHDLILLHRELSQFITMQLNKSQEKDFPYGNNNNNDNNNNDTNINIDVVDDEAGGSRSVDDDGGSWYSEDVATGNVHGGFQSTGNEGEEEDSDVHGSRRKRSSDFEEASMRKELHHSTEMKIAHKLHYASVCVVSILVVEVTMKIVCAGSHFLKRKIEVFDAVVIVTSVVVDLIFIKGLSEFAVDDSIFVLAFLLPWRVIRVVNSLVMAVIDHEQVKLRLLYSRKKKLDKTVESLRNEIDELKGMLQDIRSFCIKEGIESSRIDGMLGKFAPRRRKDSKFYTLVKLVMSTASINNNDNDSVSSSSIENDLRHISNRDSMMNLAASSRGTMTSLKQYLSVPFSDGDSNSISDVDSIAGDYSALSPSIYITSPVSDDGRGLMTFCDVTMQDTDVNMTSLEVPGHDQDNGDVATIAITSSTTNINTMNGVAFYVGSQTSLNIEHSQENLAVLGNDISSDDTRRRCGFSPALDHLAPTAAVDANKNIPAHHFGQFLTVPAYSSDNAVTGTNAPGLNYSSNNNNISDAPETTSNTTTTFITTTTTSNTLLPQGLCKNEMKRSASDNMNVTMGFSPYEGPFSHESFGSPTPTRRLQEVRMKRKIYSRSRSESEEKDSLGLVKREGKTRSRRNSGDPQSAHHRGRHQDPQRARSHSPSPMTFLAVPGSNKISTYNASRSMNDVSIAGDPYGASSGNDEIILRRSCLNLNSDGRKRRDKSPHRVSFKVS